MQAMLYREMVNGLDCDQMIEFCHQIFSHMSQKGWNLLVKKYLFPSMKGVELKHCEHFLVGKQHKLNLKNYFSLGKLHTLDLIHFDACGPMTTKIISGASYIVTFIDFFLQKGLGMCTKI